MAADFWDNPGQGGDPQVIRHAPDADQYHVPDRDQLMHMRGSLVGGFATIPAARANGASRGFNPSIAGVVHIDPDAPDGGVLFDPATITASDMSRAVASSTYPHQAFYQLGVAATRGAGGHVVPAAPQRPDTGHAPNTYVTPRSLPTGQQELAMPLPVPPIPPIQPTSQYAPTVVAPQPYVPPAVETPQYQAPPPPQAYPPQGYATPQYAPPPPALDPQLVNMLNQIANSVNSVTGRLNTLEQQTNARPATTGVSPNPMPARRLTTTPVELGQRTPQGTGDYADEAARPIRRRADVEDEETPARAQTVRQYEGDGDSREQVITGFEALGINWLTGPIGGPPTREVIFETTHGGKHQARYHQVIEEDTVIVLVYDTRYEEGHQYVPPACSGEPTPDSTIIVTLPIGPAKRSRAGARSPVKQPGKQIPVNFLGQAFSFGVFDMIVLVKGDDDAVDYPQVAE